MLEKTVKPTPERTCAATGAKGMPETFVRFVQGPKNEGGQTAPWPDLSTKGKLPGRGLYLLPTLAAYNLAIKKKVFAHHLDTNRPPLPFAELAALLEHDALRKLGLAKKAGQLVLGLEKVQEAATLAKREENMLKALLLATDAGADAQEKTARLAARLGIPLQKNFFRERLTQALGQANVTTIGFTRLDTAWSAVHKAQQAAAGVLPPSPTPAPKDI